MSRLPSWKLMTAFEAVARHRSFSRAAEELNVLQPAVSRRVAELEAELSTKLLLRSRPKAKLTADGEVLYRALATSIVQVEGAIEQVAARQRTRPVVVNLTIGFASCFLLKRLGAFRQAHPDVELELVSRDLSDGYDETSADVIIVFDKPERAPGVRQALVFGEEMIAVASPAYLADSALSLEELMEHRLLRLAAGNHVDDWNLFLAGSGIALLPSQVSQKFNSFMVYLQAALNGDGIALGWRHLLEDHLSSGQLHRLTEHHVVTDRGYYCCLTRQGQRSKGAEHFVTWLAGLVS